MKLRHPQTAEDVTQETFLRYLQAHSMQEVGRYQAYLYTIARNLCIDHARRLALYPLDTAPEPQAQSHSDRVEQVAVLEQAMDKLPEQERELLFLRYTNELSSSETGKIMGLSRFAVYRLEKKALHTLQMQLNREDFYD